MFSDSQLIEIALSGRWITAGAIWIDQSAPCTVSEAIKGIIPIMPFTIRTSNGMVATREILARDAVRRYCGGRKKELSFVIEKRETKTRSINVVQLMVAEIKANGPAKADDFAIKYASSRLSNQVDRGNLLKSGRVYYAEGQDPLQYKPRQKKVVIENSQLNESKRKP